MSEPMTEQELDRVEAMAKLVGSESQMRFVAEIRRLRAENEELKAEIKLGFCCRHRAKCCCDHCRDTSHA